MQNASVNSSRKGGGLIARTEDIHFRVQPEIRKQIETAAAASGERLSEYCVRVDLCFRLCQSREVGAREKDRSCRRHG